MLARGIRSYHRPATLETAFLLVGGGGVPLAGGTRLLAGARTVPELVDLASLGRSEISVRDGDLVLGAGLTLQDVIDAPEAYPATAGLLPEACRAFSASRQLRGMATLGGEVVFGSPDSELVAALLVLNAIVRVTGPAGVVEVPAQRFVRDAAEHLGSGGLVTSILLPGTPGGTALLRLSVVPSAPPLLAIAAAVSLTGEVVSRARLAVTGSDAAPTRIPEAEARLERSRCDSAAVAACVEEIRTRAGFRDDAHASAQYRRELVGPLVERALLRAVGEARTGVLPSPLRLWPRAEGPIPPEVVGFESGAVDVMVDGSRLVARAAADTTLLDWLRGEGLYGTKQGCETGECGSCTVLLDGRPVNACLTLAVQAHGRSVTTVEGLGSPERLHPIQEAFVARGAIQCGYCTPAMELCGAALLRAIPDPTEAEVRDALGGCLCRCTGYVKPVEAVLEAGRRVGVRR